MNNLARLEDECRYEFLAPSEMVARLKQKPILYFPIGSLEWHNEHLPLGTDAFCGIEISMRLCAETGGVVLPAFWWNTGVCHDHATTYHIPEAVYRNTLKNVCLGLANIPAKLLVLINAHGGLYQFVDVMALANTLHTDRLGHRVSPTDSFQVKQLSVYADYYPGDQDILKKLPEAMAGELNDSDFPMRVIVADLLALTTISSCKVKLDHADKGETSLALEMMPQIVRMDRDVVPDIHSGKKPFVSGQPSKKEGRELWLAYMAEAKALIDNEYKSLLPLCPNESGGN